MGKLHRLGANLMCQFLSSSWRGEYAQTLDSAVPCPTVLIMGSDAPRLIIYAANFAIHKEVCLAPVSLIPLLGLDWVKGMSLSLAFSITLEENSPPEEPPDGRLVVPRRSPPG